MCVCVTVLIKLLWFSLFLNPLLPFKLSCLWPEGPLQFGSWESFWNDCSRLTFIVSLLLGMAKCYRFILWISWARPGLSLFSYAAPFSLSGKWYFIIRFWAVRSSLLLSFWNGGSKYCSHYYLKSFSILSCLCF